MTECGLASQTERILVSPLLATSGRPLGTTFSPSDPESTSVKDR